MPGSQTDMESSSQIHKFSDVAEIQQLVKRFGFEVVYTQVSPGQLDAEAYEIHIGECLVFREHFGCHMIAHGSSAPNGFGVMVIETGLVRFFGEDVSERKVVLFPPGCTIDAVGFPGLRAFYFVLPRDRIMALATEWNTQLHQSPSALVVEPGIDRLHHLQALLGRVTEILDRSDPAAWTEAEEDLAEMLVGLFGTATPQSQVTANSNGSVARHAVKVRSYLHSCPLDQLDLDALAEELGVGRHHLNRCFKEHYGVSLHDFIHLYRLHQARGLLMAQAAELSVTEAAYSCGFNHLGRFSTEYRHLFGETPKETLRVAAQEA